MLFHVCWGRDIPGVSHNKWTPPIALFKLPADHFSLSFYRKLPQDDIYNNSPTSFATTRVLNDLVWEGWRYQIRWIFGKVPNLTRHTLTKALLNPPPFGTFRKFIRFGSATPYNLQPYTDHITDFDECNLLKQFFSFAPPKCELSLQSCSRNMKADWNFSENSSDLVPPSFPSRVPQLTYIWMSLPGASGLGKLTILPYRIFRHSFRVRFMCGEHTT